MMYLWQEYYTSDAVFSSWHFIRWHTILICPITGDVTFDHRYVNMVLGTEFCVPPKFSPNVMVRGGGALGEVIRSR